MKLSSILPDTSNTQQIITGSAISCLSKMQVQQLQSVIDEIPSLHVLHDSHNMSMFINEDQEFNAQPLTFGPKGSSEVRSSQYETPESAVSTAKSKPPPAPRLNVELMQAIQQRMCKDSKPAAAKIKLVALPWQVIKGMPNAANSIFAASQMTTTEVLKSELVHHFQVKQKVTPAQGQSHQV